MRRTANRPVDTKGTRSLIKKSASASFSTLCDNLGRRYNFFRNSSTKKDIFGLVSMWMPYIPAIPNMNYRQELVRQFKCLCSYYIVHIWNCHPNTAVEVRGIPNLHDIQSTMSQAVGLCSQSKVQIWNSWVRGNRSFIGFQGVFQQAPSCTYYSTRAPQYQMRPRRLRWFWDPGGLLNRFRHSYWRCGDTLVIYRTPRCRE